MTKKGRTPKDYSVYLTAEDKVGLTSEQITAAGKKAWDAKRKRDGRASSNKQKLQEEIDAATTPQESWNINLRTLSEYKKTVWLRRQNEVYDMIWDIEQRITGRYNEAETLALDATLPEDQQRYLSVEDADAHLRADIAEHGTLPGKSLLAFGRFWADKHRVSRYNTENPSSIFLRYGFVTAVPDHLLKEWDAFLTDRRIQASAAARPEPSLPVMTCTDCGSTVEVAPTVVAVYRNSGAEYRCVRCSKSEPVHPDDWGRA